MKKLKMFIVPLIVTIVMLAVGVAGFGFATVGSVFANSDSTIVPRAFSGVSESLNDQEWCKYT